MIWVLLITMVIKMIVGPDEIFNVPKLKKEIKTHVSDEGRRDSLLLIVKDAKKEIKAFNKVNEKDKKKMKKLMSSGENELNAIELLLKENFEKRRKQQSYNLDKRLAMQNLMTDEEWKNVIERAVSPSEKAEKKANKRDDKFDESIDKLMKATEKTISKKVEDSARKEKVMSAFHKFSSALKTQVEDGLEIDYQNNKIVGKRTATREELQGIYTNQNEFRQNVYDEFISMYNVIYENTSGSERKAIRKELKKMFK